MHTQTHQLKLNTQPNNHMLTDSKEWQKELITCFGNS